MGCTCHSRQKCAILNSKVCKEKACNFFKSQVGDERLCNLSKFSKERCLTRELLTFPISCAVTGSIQTKAGLGPRLELTPKVCNFEQSGVQRESVRLFQKSGGRQETVRPFKVFKRKVLDKRASDLSTLVHSDWFNSNKSCAVVT